MHIKFCGITNLNDALLASQKNAWALGFNFYKNSPRYIEPQKAKMIIKLLPDKILKIGIFINESPKRITASLDSLGLDLAQVYRPIKLPTTYTQRMILALQLTKENELPEPKILKTYAYLLLDATKTKDKLMGGTGRLANWTLAKKLSKQYKLILAGGINIHNVQQAISDVHPFALDLASGVESTPGIKVPLLVQKLMELSTNEI